MTKLDEIFHKKRSEMLEPSKSSIDDVLEEEEEDLAREAKKTRLEEIITGRKKRIAEDQRDIRILKGHEEEASSDVSVTPNVTAALVETLISSGVDSEKANAFIKGLDQESVAKLALLSGSQKGSQSLVPLFLLAKQPTSTVNDLIEGTKTLIETAQSLGGSSQPFTLTDFAEAVNKLRPQGDNEQYKVLIDEVRSLRDKYDQAMQRQGERELAHQKELSEQRENVLRGDVQAVRSELASLRDRDLSTEVTKSKKLLEDLGLKVGVSTGREDLQVAREIIGDVMKSKAVESLSEAAGERIRQSTSRTVAAPGQQIFCDICLKRGVRTPLTLTPEVLAGTAPLICQICGAKYEKPPK